MRLTRIQPQQYTWTQNTPLTYNRPTTAIWSQTRQQETITSWSSSMKQDNYKVYYKFGLQFHATIIKYPHNRRIIKILNRFEAINSLLPNTRIKTLVTSNMRSNGAMHMFHTCYRVIITGQSVTRNTSNTSITSNTIKIL